MHTHCKTCRKGRYGCRQCRLAKRAGHPVAETRCVECVLPAGRGAVVEGAFDWRCPICHRFDGESVAKADQKRIFEKFIQLDPSVTREFGGTGLGLTISQELSAMLHGKLDVDSTEGQGATFSITLPLVLEEKRAPLMPEE